MSTPAMSLRQFLQKTFDSRRQEKMDGYSKNPHLKEIETDVLYHLAIDNKSSDLKRMFEDVQYVVMGGSPTRMKVLADILLKELSIELPPGHGLINISGGSDRYALYKAGPIICVSHGMGNPSIAILLHEVVKLIDHAGCKNVIFLRLGTSGGLGLKPGTVVISESCVDGLFRPYLTLNILGKTIKRPAVFDAELVDKFHELATSFTEFETVKAKTLCCNDFYEEQGRLDGAICEFSEEQKFEFLNKAHDQGIRNIEMESMCFAATTHHLNIRSVVICVTLVDRMKGDQILSSKEDMAEWQERPALIAARYFRHEIGIKSPSCR